MTTLALFACAGGNCISAAAFPNPLQGRSKSGSLFTWPFMVAFQDVSPARTSGQRWVHPADSRTLRDEDADRGGVLGHPSVLPNAPHIQLTDVQLSQVQMISLLNLPFPPKSVGMMTGFHDSILKFSPSCKRESKLAGVCLSPSPAPVSRSSL